jgi:predicted GNAT family N-acyltransferase
MMTDYSVQLADWCVDAEQLSALRYEVFVDEQNVPADMEIDEMDAQCQHFKAVLEDQRVIGTARLLPDQHVGRMCIAKDFRGQGVGGSILEFIIQHARQNKIQALYLNAQLTAQPFYEKYGFVSDSAIFIEAGIQHRHMSLGLDC